MVFITLLKTLNDIAKKLTILKALSIEGAFDDNFICIYDLYRVFYDSIGRYLLGVVRMKIMMYGIEKFSYDGENIVCYNRKHDSTTVFHVGKDKSLKQVSGTICNPRGLLKMYAKHVK